MRHWLWLTVLGTQLWAGVAVAQMPELPRVTREEVLIEVERHLRAKVEQLERDLVILRAIVRKYEVQRSAKPEKTDAAETPKEP